MPDTTFALAANGFNKPSETFIRTHARKLAPGRTLLVSEKKELSRPIPAPQIILSKRLPILLPAQGGARSALFGLGDPARFGKSRSAYLAHLFKAQGVRTLMVEYGVSALHLREAARLSGCKFYVHFHGVDASKYLRDPSIVAAYKTLFQQVDGVFAPSAFLAKNLLEVGCSQDKLHVVPCGVDTTTFTTGTPKPGRMVAVGRFVEKKAPLCTIDAFMQMANDHPLARLDMFGDGPLLETAKNHVEASGFMDRITLHGRADPEVVRNALKSASLFVQHSVTSKEGDTEGLPVAILEAMSTAIPVISTLHSGIPEAVEDGVTGFLVPEHDVAGMAKRMSEVLEDPQAAAQMGAIGRRRIEQRFSEEITVQKLQTVMDLF